MNPRTHLSLVPAASTDGTHRPDGDGHPSPAAARRPAGGRAAGVTAVAAGLTLGLALGAIATLGSHPGEFTALLLPAAAAAGITIAAAFRSRAVARRRHRSAAVRRQRDDRRRRALRPKPVLVHSGDEFHPVLIATRSVAQLTQRAA